MRKAPKPPRKRSAAQRTREPTYADLLAIVQLIESGSRFSDFRLRSGDIEVEVHRGNGSARVDGNDSGPASNDASAAGPDAPRGNAAASASHRTPVHADLPAGTLVIPSPMVGTFYRGPEPGAPPFVEVGTHVKPDTVVCIIEVMKLMNSVTAGVTGIVSHVLAENAHMVEYGQSLIAIKPGK
jgi:acetyl-CoA carboxylase biotin carboxyl carrier protein